jgi:DNA-binding LacI/PurR family transcriptional regulator
MDRPSPQEVRELAAAAAVDERTVRRAYQAPERIKEVSRLRVAGAAVRLGLTPPPGRVLAMTGPEALGRNRT